ncbi:MAG: hypothetical protein WCA35_02645 [Kovacikia sp.]
MATNYILFIHGVNTRQQREGKGYSHDLFGLIQSQNQKLNPSSTLKQVELYWGDLNKGPEDQLRNDLEHSKDWNKFWFKDFRLNQLLQFAGDAALYTSRYMGSKVVASLLSQIESGLTDYQEDDRVHLVTHSWGTVILFDVLFASRWTDPTIPGYQNVQTIRNTFFGIKPNPFEGIKIGSLHTMGSPISIFSLMDVQQGVDETATESASSHDITPRLQTLLKNLAEAQSGKVLPWRNFAHPGDPIAYPLSITLPRMVDGENKYLDIQDVITHNADLFDFLTEPVSQNVLALLHGGDAHSSYWKSQEVAQRIAEEIHQLSN